MIFVFMPVHDKQTFVVYILLVFVKAASIICINLIYDFLSSCWSHLGFVFVFEFPLFYVKPNVADIAYTWATFVKLRLKPIYI